MGKCTLQGIVMKQMRRSEMSIEEKRIKRNILRKNTGKHLLTRQLHASWEISRKIEKAKRDLTTPVDVVTS